MKRFLAVFLAFAIVFSLFSLAVFAENPENNVFIPDFDKGFTADFEILNINENRANQIGSIYVKGSKFAIDSNIPIFEKFNITIRVAYNGNELILYSPYFPFFYIPIDDEEIFEEAGSNFKMICNGNIEAINTYEITSGSQTITVFEYINSDGVLSEIRYDQNGMLISCESVDNEGYKTLTKFTGYAPLKTERVFEKPVFSLNFIPFAEVINALFEGSIELNF